MLADPSPEQLRHRKQTRQPKESTETVDLDTAKQKFQQLKNSSQDTFFTSWWLICAVPKLIIDFCWKKTCSLVGVAVSVPKRILTSGSELVSSLVGGVLVKIQAGPAYVQNQGTLLAERICAVPNRIVTFGSELVSSLIAGVSRKIQGFSAFVYFPWTLAAKVLNLTKGIVGNIVDGLITDALQVRDYLLGFLSTLPGWNIVVICISFVQTIVIYIFAVILVASKKALQFAFAPFEFSKKVFHLLIKLLPLLPRFVKTAVLRAFDTFRAVGRWAFRKGRSWIGRFISFWVDILKPGHLLGDIKAYLTYIMVELKAIVISVAVAVAAIVFTAVTCYCCCWRKRNNERRDVERQPIIDTPDSYGSNEATLQGESEVEEKPNDGPQAQDTQNSQGKDSTDGHRIDTPDYERKNTPDYERKETLDYQGKDIPDGQKTDVKKDQGEDFYMTDTDKESTRLSSLSAQKSSPLKPDTGRPDGDKEERDTSPRQPLKSEQKSNEEKERQSVGKHSPSKRDTVRHSDGNEDREPSPRQPLKSEEQKSNEEKERQSVGKHSPSKPDAGRHDYGKDDKDPSPRQPLKSEEQKSNEEKERQSVGKHSLSKPDTGRHDYGKDDKDPSPSPSSKSDELRSSQEKERYTSSRQSAEKSTPSKPGTVRHGDGEKDKEPSPRHPSKSEERRSYEEKGYPSSRRSAEVSSTSKEDTERHDHGEEDRDRSPRRSSKSELRSSQAKERYTSSRQSVEKYSPSKQDTVRHGDGEEDRDPSPRQPPKSEERRSYEEKERHTSSRQSVETHSPSKPDRKRHSDGNEDREPSPGQPSKSEERRSYEEKERSQLPKPEPEPEEKVIETSQLILSQATYDDARNRPVWEAMMSVLRARLPGASYKIQLGSLARNQPRSLVVLPCIVASRMGSDVEAAVNSSQIPDSEKILLLLFHHKAPHNSKVFPTRQKGVGNRDIEQRLRDIIDFVFWQGDLYDCDTNRRALQELVDAVTIKKAQGRE